MKRHTILMKEINQQSRETLNYRFKFIDKWQTTNFRDVKLQAIELRSNSFNQLAIQLTTQHTLITYNPNVKKQKLVHSHSIFDFILNYSSVSHSGMAHAC